MVNIILDALCVFLVLSATILWRQYGAKRARAGLPLPPGPPGLPLLGNFFDVPKTYEWITYRDWSNKYGSDVIHYEVFGTHTIVVNTARAANELFEKRSAMYSDRPPFTGLRIFGIEWIFDVVPYGPTWRLLRKTFQEEFRPDILARYQEVQQTAVHALLRTLVTEPNNFRDNIKHMTGKVIMRIAYGANLDDPKDPYVHVAENTVSLVNLGVSFRGALLDYFPFLQRMPSWFPGAGLKKHAAKARASGINRAAIDAPWITMKESVSLGDDKYASAASHIYHKYKEDPATLEVLKAVPANMYLGGADTTVSSLTSLFMAMALYPDVQKKAQEELDSVLRGSLPTFADKDSLPYTSALVKEVFRWYPVSPTATPHAVTEDDVYEGMFIPRGSTVIGNVWAILHDPKLYPDPESFNPAHFISADDGGTYPAEACTNGEPPFPQAVFGFARRVCPGRALAKPSVWLTVANILSTFEITPAKDENGGDVPIVQAWSSGIVGYPGPFECAITPRSEKARETVMATAGEESV